MPVFMWLSLLLLPHWLQLPSPSVRHLSNSRDEVALPVPKPANQLLTVVPAILAFCVPTSQDKEGNAAKFRKGSKGRVCALTVDHAAEDIYLDNRKLQKTRQMVTNVPHRVTNFMVVGCINA